MKRKLIVLVATPLLVVLLAFGAVASASGKTDSTGRPKPGGQWDDAVFCSRWLARHGNNSLPPELNERCVLAIATTYIDGEQNSIPPEDILFAPDVSRHLLGTPANFQPGSAASLVQGYHNGSSATILSITERHWVVEGQDAWINYTGFLKCNSAVPGFYVGERITVQRGLIHEILIAGVVVPPGVCPAG
jgi:hypothetical protein